VDLAPASYHPLDKRGHKLRKKTPAMLKGNYTHNNYPYSPKLDSKVATVNIQGAIKQVIPFGRGRIPKQKGGL
jgi:hypothetical protein